MFCTVPQCLFWHVVACTLCARCKQRSGLPVAWVSRRSAHSMHEWLSKAIICIEGAHLSCLHGHELCGPCTTWPHWNRMSHFFSPPQAASSCTVGILLLACLADYNIQAIARFRHVCNASSPWFVVLSSMHVVSSWMLFYAVPAYAAQQAVGIALGSQVKVDIVYTPHT